MVNVPGTEFDVRPLALGGNVFGWTADRATSFAVLDAFVDAEGSLLDTADGYSAWVPGNTGGESETIIGEWFRRSGKRDRIVLATKVATHPDFTGLAPANIAAAADASLTRLGTGHIDLYYAHFDDDTQTVPAMAQAFDALVRAGKVRHVALSNFSVEREREWIEFSRKEGLAVPVALQPQYNLLHRGDVEGGYGPLAEEYHLAVFPYFSLASGFLTGKYATLADLEGAARSQGIRGYLTDDAHTDAAFQVIDVARAIGESRGAAVTSVALAWLLAKKSVTAPIASARTVDQLPDLLAATELTLTGEEIEALDTASDIFR